ncbi:HAD family hydrolase [Massilia sp. TS11]|uniref:KdsC family phosphatase n=1 Tax=Massilia sp. TS11 TaxID=2908003 RepID=UPI001EDB1BDA|nr:HAD family hydrolase [Massilia sp. TS11]MCG2584955.1 HAD family hydrolase [Massilia sp. TS11]
MLPLTDIEQRAARVKLMIFDVDGVLTDGSMHYDANGECMKTFFVNDGLGIQLLNQSGVQTAIISARTTPIVNVRAQVLGITHVYQGHRDKRVAFQELTAKLGIAPEECGYIGDDVIDMPLLARVGFAVTVPTGHPEVRHRVHYVTRAGGGRGAVREVCDLIMKAQGTYDKVLAGYFD